MVFGPITPSVAPVSWPRAISRSCSSIFSVRESSRSPRGQAAWNGPPPMIRSPRWPTPIA